MIRKKEMKFNNRLKKKLIMLTNTLLPPPLKELECLQKQKQTKETKDSLLTHGKVKFLNRQGSNILPLCPPLRTKTSELKEPLGTEHLTVVRI